MRSFSIIFAFLATIFFVSTALANPTITSVSPTTLPIFGATITITGSGFNSILVVYVQIGALPIATSFVKSSDTQISATFAAVGQSYSSRSVFVGYGAPNYVQLTNAVSYSQPSITSVLWNGQNYMPSYQTNTVTIHGDYFGTSTSVYSYVQFGTYPIATAFSVLSNTQMTATFDALWTNSNKENLYLAWGSGPYSELVGAFCWCCDGNSEFCYYEDACVLSPCYP
jgi:hypothetical protein